MSTIEEALELCEQNIVKTRQMHRELDELEDEL